VRLTVQEGSVLVPDAGGGLGQHRVDVVDCTHLNNQQLYRTTTNISTDVIWLQQHKELYTRTKIVSSSNLLFTALN
jgi:hypothetical protein